MDSLVVFLLGYTLGTHIVFLAFVKLLGEENYMEKIPGFISMLKGDKELV